MTDMTVFGPQGTPHSDGVAMGGIFVASFVVLMAIALLALLLTWLASVVISRNFIQTEFFSRGLASLGILGGAVIGVLGSSLSVGRHLRKI